MSERRSFWSTFPGVIAGLAAIVSGLGVLIPVLLHMSRTAVVHHRSGTGGAAASTPTPGGSPTPGGAGGSPTETGVPGGPGSMNPGTGPAGGLTATPSTLDFGQAALGSSSSVVTVTITNAGSGAVTIGGIELNGAQASEFSIASSTCGTGAVLAPGGSCQVGVRLDASTVGSPTASLVVNVQQPSGSVTVPVSGTVGLL